MWNGCMSSASIPFAFPNHQWNGNSYMDGGTIYNVNIDSAIQQCLEQVDGDLSKITVDIAICSYSEVPTEDASEKAINNYL